MAVPSLLNNRLSYQIIEYRVSRTKEHHTEQSIVKTVVMELGDLNTIHLQLNAIAVADMPSERSPVSEASHWPDQKSLL